MRGARYLSNQKSRFAGAGHNFDSLYARGLDDTVQSHTNHSIHTELPMIKGSQSGHKTRNREGRRKTHLGAASPASDDNLDPKRPPLHPKMLTKGYANSKQR